MLLTNALPADNKATIENLLFTEGGIVSGVFAGDSILTGYWGVAINLNYGGAAYSGIPGYGAGVKHMFLVGVLSQ